MAVAMEFTHALSAGSACGFGSPLTRCSMGVQSPNFINEASLHPVLKGFQGSRGPHQNRLGQGTAIYSSWPKSNMTQRRFNVRRRRPQQCRAQTYTVEVFHEGQKHVLKVPEDETILSVALEEDLVMPHDCKLGVCMTCPAKLEKGNVDQSGGMLSDDVVDQGYALMCVSYPLSDCTIRTIPEEELLNLQLATSDV